MDIIVRTGMTTMNTLLSDNSHAVITRLVPFFFHFCRDQPSVSVAASASVFLFPRPYLRLISPQARILLPWGFPRAG